MSEFNQNGSFHQENFHCRSERVRIYMGGEEFKDKALFAF